MFAGLTEAMPGAGDAGQGEALARGLLVDETRGLLARLNRFEPLALVESAVPAAAPPPCTLWRIDRHLAREQRTIAEALHSFLAWLRDGAGRLAPVTAAQRRLSLLRIRFVAALTDYDVFSDVLTQRSERRNGVWLSGLDAVAHDALALPGRYYAVPPLLCYLDRGRGAAIRRLRTRLPSGRANPVAIIRVPRERLLGTAVASSLVHEVGHQGSALLDLVPSLGPTLRAMQRHDSPERLAWHLLERWLSEIVADLWSVARVGVAATLGLVAVLSLPNAFVLHVTDDDPHPAPWLRVLLSAALGEALYPHPQWGSVAQIWRTLYPLRDAQPATARILTQVEQLLPTFAALLVSHRPRRLRGASIQEALASPDRSPTRLLASFDASRARPRELLRESPSRALAILGQARATGQLDAVEETRLLDRLLTSWALKQMQSRAEPHCTFATS